MPDRSERAGRVRTRAVAVLGVIAILLTGCSGDKPDPVATIEHFDASRAEDAQGNGLTLLTGADARLTIIDSMRGKSVAMSGTFSPANGTAVTATVEGTRDRYAASVSQGAERTEIIRIDNDAYLRTGQPSTISDMPFQCVSADVVESGANGQYLDAHKFVGAMTTDASAVSAVTGETVDVILGSEGTAGVLTVASNGAPLPQRLLRADLAGTLDFSFEKWGTADAPTAPTALGEGC